MYHSQGSYPIKIQCTITSLENLDKEAKQYEEAWFNNEPVPDDHSDLVWIPFGRTNEFFERYQQLINEFNDEASRIDNEIYKKEHSP